MIWRYEIKSYSMKGKLLRTIGIKSSVNPSDERICRSLWHVKNGPCEQAHKMFHEGKQIDRRYSKL